MTFLYYGVCAIHGHTQVWKFCPTMPLWCQWVEDLGNRVCLAPLAVEMRKVP